ncbi:MAG: FixJ family two-component response regulator, partial [Verrucomicrobiales bacterium]
MLTGNEDEEAGVDAVGRGAQDFLCKGALDTNVLRRVIRYAIERKQTESALREARDQAEA